MIGQFAGVIGLDMSVKSGRNGGEGSNKIDLTN